MKGTLDAIQLELARATRRATERSGHALKLRLRERTDAAFPPKTRLAQTWRGDVYPDASSTTLEPAYYVYTKAPKIIHAFDKGATIRARNGVYLAIPAPAAGVRQWNRALTPREWQAATGIELTFVPLAGGQHALLVAHAYWQRQAPKYRHRRKFSPILARIMSRGQRFVPIFYLSKQTTLRKRLDIEAIAREFGGSFRDSLERELAKME
ncbi:hypothetical protein CQW49_05220 [Methylosinus trichosporium OB3b]|uniref:Uncharacterized protein n=2 Tax=Methylocystaceae TaxID=31993 RepID=A0A2D2CX73_METT3|nr:hypothetical protein CQW49_05220 [Methylosinus trichosporium OB3b]OBS51626.1 hypothetical protein A8B73_15560 [Methylosinus sp. 3S-1]